MMNRRAVCAKSITIVRLLDRNVCCASNAMDIRSGSKPGNREGTRTVIARLRFSLRCESAGMARQMITPDGGGSNGSRVRLFKVELQNLAHETGLSLRVCHYPPVTSKWNRMEQDGTRLFCHITQNLAGKALATGETVVELIAATTTRTILTVKCELNTRSYLNPAEPEPKRV
jgi:Rhodopirellula transposase DDE domain